MVLFKALLFLLVALLSFSRGLWMTEDFHRHDYIEFDALLIDHNRTLTQLTVPNAPLVNRLRVVTADLERLYDNLSWHLSSARLRFIALRKITPGSAFTRYPTSAVRAEMLADLVEQKPIEVTAAKGINKNTLAITSKLLDVHDLRVKYGEEWFKTIDWVEQKRAEDQVREMASEERMRLYGERQKMQKI